MLHRAFYTWYEIPCKYKCDETHSRVKVHVVGDDVDIGMEDVVLLNHLFQDVSNTSWEDQQRDLLLLQMVKKHFVAIPKEITHCPLDTRTNDYQKKKKRH